MPKETLLIAEKEGKREGKRGGEQKKKKKKKKKMMMMMTMMAAGRAGDTKIDGGWVGGPESGLGKVIARHGRQTHARSVKVALVGNIHSSFEGG